MRKVPMYRHLTCVAVLLLGAFMVGLLSSCSPESSHHGVAPSTPTPSLATSTTPTAGNLATGHQPVTGLNDIAMVSATNGWAVGDGILHYDGIHWTQVSSPPNHMLQAIAMVSATDGWAVGDTIFHYDGRLWAEVACPVACMLSHIVMVSATDGWATGAQIVPRYGPALPLLLHYDGAAWNQMPAPPNALWLNGVSMDSSRDGWILGMGNESLNAPDAWHFDGTKWNEVRLAANDGPISSVSLVSPTDGWAVGYGVILHYDGRGWHQV